MKKLVTVIAALALIAIAGSSAHAQDPCSFPVGGTLWNHFSSGGDLFENGVAAHITEPTPGEFHVVMASTLPHSDFNNKPECFDLRKDIVLQSTTMHVLANSLLLWSDAYAESDFDSGTTFRVDATFSFPGFGEFVANSQPIPLCSITGASEKLCDICNPGNCEDPEPDPDPDPDPDPGAVCGDGILASTEECEDGNTINGDGCSDACELEIDPDPNNPVIDDMDQDGIPDAQDTDNDNDGWTDAEEDECVTDPLDANDMPLDDDGDGLCNLLDDDQSLSTGTGDGFTSSGGDGGGCSLNPSAPPDYSRLFLLTLLCLSAPIAVTLHIRKRC